MIRSKLLRAVKHKILQIWFVLNSWKYFIFLPRRTISSPGYCNYTGAHAPFSSVALDPRDLIRTISDENALLGMFALEK